MFAKKIFGPALLCLFCSFQAFAVLPLIPILILSIGGATGITWVALEAGNPALDPNIYVQLEDHPTGVTQVDFHGHLSELEMSLDTAVYFLSTSGLLVYDVAKNKVFGVERAEVNDVLQNELALDSTSLTEAQSLVAGLTLAPPIMRVEAEENDLTREQYYTDAFALISEFKANQCHAHGGRFSGKFLMNGFRRLYVHSNLMAQKGISPIDIFSGGKPVLCSFVRDNFQSSRDLCLSKSKTSAGGAKNLCYEALSNYTNFILQGFWRSNCGLEGGICEQKNEDFEQYHNTCLALVLNHCTSRNGTNDGAEKMFTDQYRSALIESMGEFMKFLKLMSGF